MADFTISIRIVDNIRAIWYNFIDIFDNYEVSLSRILYESTINNFKELIPITCKLYLYLAETQIDGKFLINYLMILWNFYSIK